MIVKLFEEKDNSVELVDKGRTLLNEEGEDSTQTAEDSDRFFKVGGRERKRISKADPEKEFTEIDWELPANLELEKRDAPFRFTKRTTSVGGSAELHQIKAITAFSVEGAGEPISVQAGDLGGFVENSWSLKNGAWLDKDSYIYDRGIVYRNSYLEGSTVTGFSRVSGRVTLRNTKAVNAFKVKGYDSGRVLLENLTVLDGHNNRDQYRPKIQAKGSGSFIHVKDSSVDGSGIMITEFKGLTVTIENSVIKNNASITATRAGKEESNSGIVVRNSTVAGKVANANILDSTIGDEVRIGVGLDNKIASMNKNSAEEVITISNCTYKGPVTKYVSAEDDFENAGKIEDKPSYVNTRTIKIDGKATEVPMASSPEFYQNKSQWLTGGDSIGDELRFRWRIYGTPSEKLLNQLKDNPGDLKQSLLTQMAEKRNKDKSAPAETQNT